MSNKNSSTITIYQSTCPICSSPARKKKGFLFCSNAKCKSRKKFLSSIKSTPDLQYNDKDGYIMCLACKEGCVILQEGKIHSDWCPWWEWCGKTRYAVKMIKCDTRDVEVGWLTMEQLQEGNAMMVSCKNQAHRWIHLAGIGDKINDLIWDGIRWVRNTGDSSGNDVQL